MMLRGTLSVIGLCFLLSACGTNRVREQIPEGFQSGTLILGTVEVIYSRAQVVQNTLPDITTDSVPDLREMGVQESDITDGSEVGILTYCYAHNSVVGCFTHMGFYLAHVPVALREQIKKAALVSIKVRKVGGDRLIGEVTHVYGDANDPKLGCVAKKLNYKGLASFSPYGPPVASWLDCPKIAEDEGWMRVCVRTAPPPGPSGEPSCVSELKKLPQNK